MKQKWKLISDEKEYFRTLYNHAKTHKPIRCKISTFGFYVGGVVSPYKSRQLLTLRSIALHCRRVDVYIGVTEESEGVIKNITRQLSKLPHMGNVKFHFMWKWHVKCVTFSDNWCMIGGRNWSGSNWHDLSFWIRSKMLHESIVKELP